MDDEINSRGRNISLLFKSVIRSVQGNGNDRHLGLHGQPEAAFFKLLHFYPFSPCPFGKDNEGISLFQKLDAFFNGPERCPGIVPFNKNAAYVCNPGSKFWHLSQTLLRYETDLPVPDSGKKHRYIPVALMVGYKDHGTFRQRF